MSQAERSLSWSRAAFGFLDLGSGDKPVGTVLSADAPQPVPVNPDITLCGLNGDVVGWTDLR